MRTVAFNVVLLLFFMIGQTQPNGLGGAMNDIPADVKNQLDSVVLEKAKQFSDYIEKLGGNGSDKKDAYKLALEMFDSPEGRVEVSLLGKPGTRSYSIKEYLDRLKLLPYDRVDVEWSDATKLTDYKKHNVKNGVSRYSGVMTVLQEFTGYIAGNIEYSDFTIKKIEVVVLKCEKHNGEIFWEVKFDNIYVLKTGSNKEQVNKD